MRKKLITLLLAVCLFASTAGCALTTTGEGSWEIYGGVRTTQTSDQPAEVKIRSNIINKIVESFADGEITEAE